MSKRLCDGHGREINYLRVSITDRCNLRCAYCMPPSGVELYPRCDILRYKDLLRLVSIFGGLGVRKVRFTGGEPLVRKGVVGFIKQARDIEEIKQIALTTNGTLLPKMAKALKDAGVARVNISLDTLKRERFRSITGHDGFDKTMKGIQAALDAGFESVKINMVVIAGVNDDEIEDFARLSLTTPAQIRFIEFMPATPEVWDESRLVPMSEVKRRVERLGPLAACDRYQWGGPAKIYRMESAAGEVGFISAVSRHFCGECNRLRLTSTGGLLTCLFGKDKLNLKRMLDDGATDGQIEDAIINEVSNKNAIRVMETKPGDHRRDTMSCVGG